MTAEERIAALEANQRLLSSYLRRSATRDARADAAALDARLAPGGLTTPGLRGFDSRAPDLGSPLMERLGGDAALAHSIAGSGLSAISTGTILDDPTFEFLQDVVPVTTSWQDAGPYWQVRYVLESGTAPTTISLYAFRDRDFWSSSVASLEATWANATDVGVITMQLRSKRVVPGGGYWSDPFITWPWGVAAGRVSSGGLTTGDGGQAYATVSIIDGDDQSVLVTSDDFDITAIAPVRLEAQPYVGLDDPDTATVALLDIQFDIQMESASSSLATAMTIVIAEPQLHYADEETPRPTEPAIGRWNPIPRVVGARTWRTGDQTNFPDSTWTTIHFQTASATTDYDTLAIHDLATNDGDRWLIPVHGLWRCDISCAIEADTVNSRQVRIVRHKVGGGTVEEASVRIGAAPTGRTTVPLATEFECDAGDYITFDAWQDSGSNLSILGDATDKITVASVRLVGWME